MARLLVFVLAAALAGPSLACSKMGGVPSDRTVLEEAISVVRARVTTINMKEVPRSVCDAVICEYAEVGYAVLENFKGTSRRSGMVKASQCIACGFCFEVGQEYLFFVAPDESVNAFSSALLDEEGKLENASRIDWLREQVNQ